MSSLAAAAAVKRVALWWAGIEEWMAVHLPEAVDSLNIGKDRLSRRICLRP